MRVKDFDTNGLIHAMNFEKSGTDDQLLFDAAILNIIQAQGFSCIPLVDKPRVRKNLMNLVDRAIYKDNCGNVTHISRLPIYEGEEGIITIPVDQLPIVDENEGLIPAMIKFFSSSYNDKCQLILLVGDDCKQPSAMVTMNEMKSDQVRQSLFLTLATEGFKTGKNNLIGFGYDLYLSLDKLGIDLMSVETQKGLISINESLKTIKKIESIDTITQRISSIPNLSSIKDLKVQDIMTPIAVGVIHDDSESEVLAAKMLNKANDFDYLVTYLDLKRELANYIYPFRKGKLGKLIDRRNINLTDSIEKMLQLLSESPNPLVIYDEESMDWPSIITKDVITNSLFLHYIGELCVKVEIKIVNLFKSKGVGEIKINRSRGPIFVKVDEATLGQLINSGEGQSIVSDKLKKLISGPSVERRNEGLGFLRNSIFHSLLGGNNKDYQNGTFNPNICLTVFETRNELND